MARTLIALVLFVGCTEKKAATAPADIPATVSTVTKTSEKLEGDCNDEHEGKKGEIVHRGEGFKSEKAVALSEVLSSPEKYDGQTLRTEGVVRQVCQKAGCWMELATTEKSTGARVTFKDYGFFVPKDAQRSHAKVEGTIKLTELSESRAKHYTDEGATVPRGADGKPREIQIVASAVELTKP